MGLSKTRGILLFIVCLLICPGLWSASPWVQKASGGGEKNKLIRYYQTLTAFMKTPDYRNIMNSFDEVVKKENEVAEQCGFADSDALAEAEEKFKEDPQVKPIYDTRSALTTKLKEQNNADNTGKVSVNYTPTNKKKFKEIYQIMKESKILELLAAHVNSLFFLPEDLTISLEECQEENAFYDSERKTIIVCYEMIKYYKEYLEKSGDNEEIMVDLVFFDVFHEFGHALIDVFNLPITGKEEDVADQLAIWLTLETTGEDDNQSIQSVLNAAYWFNTGFDKENVAVEDLPFWDTHSLDLQRYHNIICWSYGYNADLTSNTLGEEFDGSLPEDRRVLCEEEYSKMYLSFVRLLYRYMKE